MTLGIAHPINTQVDNDSGIPIYPVKRYGILRIGLLFDRVSEVIKSFLHK